MPRVTAFPRGALLAALLLVLLGTVGFALDSMLSGHGSRAIRGYTADRGVPRIPFDGDPADVMLVRDFDVLDGELYLLDVAASRVTVMADSAGGLRTVRSFGRRGRGPGELFAPSGIAVLPLSQEVVIADRGALHYFARTGEYERTRAPALPCALAQPRIAAAGHGLLLSGRCIVADTVMAELLWLASADTAVRIASEPLYALSGGGSPLAASSFYTPGPGHGLFGGGGSDCVARIDLRTAPPSSERMCSIAATSYAFIPDAELRAKSKALAAARPWAARSFDLPDHLPVYVDRLVWQNVDFVVRPVTSDSIAFRAAGSEEDLAVAGFNDLVGCRETGCLWLRHDASPRVMFVESDSILRRRVLQ